MLCCHGGLFVKLFYDPLHYLFTMQNKGAKETNIKSNLHWKPVSSALSLQWN